MQKSILTLYRDVVGNRCNEDLHGNEYDCMQYF